MPKTKMATFRRVVSLGIIVLLVNCLVHSLDLPREKEEEGKNEDNTRKKVMKQPEDRQEEQKSESDRQVDKEEHPPETRENLVKERHDNGRTMEDDHEQARADKPSVAKEEEKKENNPKLRFMGGQRLNQSKCTEDIARLCPEIPKGNNFALLVCLQEKAKEDDLTEECHHMLWEYKRTFSKDAKFEKSVEERFCVADLKLLPECKQQGKIIPCLLEHRQNLTTPSCKHMMTKMQAIFFSDYRLIERFLEDCSADINQRKCGRIQTEEIDEEIHSQNDVLECLEEHQEDLAPDCQKQIFRLAELSSDDFHLDRPLYYACIDDRERFCEKIPSGEGRVYKCLKKHKKEETMSDECREKLRERQKVEAKDPKANYPLMKNCFKFYQQYKEEYQCEKGKTKHGTLANILICLERAVQEDRKVSPKCQAELFDLRQQLMEDYSINPEVVAKCEVELDKHCKVGKDGGGQTIDCLMDLAEEHEGKDNTISEGCFKAIEGLLEEAGAGRDYRIDSTLYEACEPIVQTVCKDKGKKEGDVMVLSCLMENLHTDNMTPECEEQLLHLEFFIARDFRLDAELQKVCKDDAKSFCHAPSLDDEESYPTSLVISCLYRNSILGTSEAQVSPKCAAHVKRVMHQRAVDVHLMPEIQMACVQDLGKHCSDKLDKGEEIQCLQDKFDDLGQKCQNAIGNFTEEEGEDYELDSTLVRACRGMVSKFCGDVIAQGNAEGVLPCLVEHKNDQGMDERCHAAIEHWQLIEMKDFRFSPEFKRACRRDAQEYCSDMKDKFGLVECLSKRVRDAVINGEEHTISDQCRVHLRVEKEEESEDLRLDPITFAACMNDIEGLCKGVQYGRAKVLECLKDNRKKLSEECRKKILEREEEEMKDPEVDYKLERSCRKMISLFCEHANPSEIFDCLKKNKNQPEMERSCKDMIIKRQIRQAQDVVLNPLLLRFCELDLPKFCGKDSSTGGGKIIACLKKHYDNLSDECRGYTAQLMREAGRDYRMDARLVAECKDEVKRLCTGKESSPSQVTDCLKKNIGSIQSKPCRVEVFRLVKEGRSDLKSDPVLYSACSLEVKRFCSDIPFGRGKVIKCLVEAFDTNRARFDKECQIQLSSRRAMWGQAVKAVPGESLGDLAAFVIASPSKNYFFIVFATCLALIFVGGLVFGRLSKRIKKEVKDR
ncbi:Golgi apparatus protein 1-like [Montipora foliosa]|uniref:Golgi apparatus protein 1-like n=1 Tax=Montipora foliosa TaxID=591990 RepID=UPI0035F18619